LVSELTRLARTQKKKIMLLFDTTELLQTEMKFWTWLETNLVGPLVLDGGIRQVFAGRNCRTLAEDRGAAQSTNHFVKKLPSRLYLRGLAVSLLKFRGLEWDEDKLENILVNIMDRFSFGHPRLALALAEKIISDWNTKTVKEYLADKATYEREICQQVIEVLLKRFSWTRCLQPGRRFCGGSVHWKSLLIRLSFENILKRSYLTK